MRRFFRSAAFPILIVIVLAFFAQRLINDPLDRADADLRASSSPRSRTTRARSTTVTLPPEDNTIDVEQQDGKSYSTGYPTQATRRAA